MKLVDQISEINRSLLHQIETNAHIFKMVNIGKK